MVPCFRKLNTYIHVCIHIYTLSVYTYILLSALFDISKNKALTLVELGSKFSF